MHPAPKDWPGVFGDEILLRRLFSALANRATPRQLDAFICVPATWSTNDDYDNLGFHHVPECHKDSVINEALPLLLAYVCNCYSLLENKVPPGTEVDVALHAGRLDLPNYREAVAKYHSRAVNQHIKKNKLEVLHVAACLTGLARSLTDPAVYLSLAENGTFFGAAKVSIFYVVDFQNRPLSDFMTVFQYLPPANIAILDNRAWGHPKKCDLHPEHLNCHHQFQDLRTCMSTIGAAEDAQGRKFDWLVRLRTDMRWAAPIGDLSTFDNSGIHLIGRLGSAGDLCDRFALIPRRFFHEYFGITCLAKDDYVELREQCYPGKRGNMYTCECALTARMRHFGIKVIAFPEITFVVRSRICYNRDHKCDTSPDIGSAPS